MANPGDVFVNPVTGMSVTFRRTASETGGALTEMEARYPPASVAPPEHYHPFQEERFEVLAGQLRARLAGVERTLLAGEVLTVPRGTPHTMWNNGEVEARALWQTTPALKTEQFHETAYALAQQRKVNARGTPDLLQSAVFLREHRNEFRLARLPNWLQLILLGVVAPIGLMLGRKAEYSYRAPLR